MNLILCHSQSQTLKTNDSVIVLMTDHLLILATLWEGSGLKAYFDVHCIAHIVHVNADSHAGEKNSKIEYFTVFFKGEMLGFPSLMKGIFHWLGLDTGRPTTFVCTQSDTMT